MAAALFDCVRPWPNYDDPRLAEFDIPVVTSFWNDVVSTDWGDGGFVLLRKEKAIALLRYPRFKFRPSQSDLLHVDLWVDGKNLLRDAGTYSYNTEPQWLDYFGGTASHNTLQFDGRDQMPRISRFLLGDWLKTRRLEALQESSSAVQFGAGYRDGQGSSHFRRIRLVSPVFMRVSRRFVLSIFARI